MLQFLGLVNEFYGKRPGQREVSFLGIHDFAAFSAAALAIGFAGHRARRAAAARVGRGRRRRGRLDPRGVGVRVSGVVLAAIAAAVGRACAPGR